MKIFEVAVAAVIVVVDAVIVVAVVIALVETFGNDFFSCKEDI